MFPTDLPEVIGDFSNDITLAAVSKSKIEVEADLSSAMGRVVSCQSVGQPIHSSGDSHCVDFG